MIQFTSSTNQNVLKEALIARIAFSPRDAMHERGLCRRAVSVRPSITFVYSVEANKLNYLQFFIARQHTDARY